MPFIEAPTTFYMGRRYDPASNRLVDEVVYYDSRDLTTHAVVVGMTGSGKTGLCITLLEEAVMDNIPSIVIDPKGDITNLLLAFPELRPEDFEPWVNVDDARRTGLEVDEYAADVAQKWRDGLASWNITQQRVQQFKDSARFSIYTPGSDAGLPISILDAMQAPHGGWQAGDDEFHRERIAGIVTALLALIGRNVEPVKDREHVLISNIFEVAWRHGINLTLEDVILQVQKPPFNKLGVFDIDTFFAEKDRFKLAMELNNIIASPSFQSWIQGEPLDIQSLLYTPEGKPRVSIFYIAHLSDAERMFIVTLLLENMLSWMRGLSGTTSLRALMYFDEMFGFFPPHPYNPPSKEPIMRLLKQARAFGLGMVLATQNPGDLDYKGLSNAGTWFIGKLQTENDKKKVLSGLEMVETVDSKFNIADMDRLLSDLDPRVFVMHNVHDNMGAIPIHTRWAMSFLRGPLTRQQIRILMAKQKNQPYYPSYQQQHASGYGPGGAQPYGQPAPSGATPPPMSLPEMPPTLPETGPYATNIPQPASLPDSGGYEQQPPFRPGSTPPPATLPDEYTTQRSGNVTNRSGDISLPDGYSLNPPALSASTVQFFLPSEIPQERAIGDWERRTGQRAESFGGARLAYKPILLAQAEVRFSDRKSSVTDVRIYTYQVPHVERAGLIYWDEYEAAYVDPKSVSGEAFGEAIYGELSPGLTDSKRLTALKNELTDYIYKTKKIVILYNPELDIYSESGMRERDFRVMAQTIARQKRDDETDKVVAKYDKTFDTLETKLRKTARDLAAEQQELDALRNEEMFTAGEAVLSLLRGRTTYTLSRVSRTRRYKGQAREDVYEAEQVIAELEDQLAETQHKMEQELAQINDKWLRVANMIENYEIAPYKKDIYAGLFGIGWQPHWLIVVNGVTTLIPAWNDQAQQYAQQSTQQYTPQQAQTLLPGRDQQPDQYGTQPGYDQGGYDPRNDRNWR
ncbi:MAG: DUF87 domain-containing protein [Anaerolineae bacterium]|nr:DUF87 domain-containing protein [Anaerolineae bacterium]